MALLAGVAGVQTQADRLLPGDGDAPAGGMSGVALDHRVEDAIAGREHFYRRDLDPRRWLRVVVDFNDEPAWVVTALVQNNPPRGYKQ